MQADQPSTAGYNNVAHDYDKGRPDYPLEIIPFLTTVLELQPNTTVLDLAAGTGKVTKALKPLGLNLCAVEPVAEMRKVFAHLYPDVPILDGTAEKIPLPNGSVDVVIVGTAFHWFDTEKALAEIARVLKPGGRLGLIWNARANEVDWVKKVCSVLENTTTHDKMQWREEFEKTTLFAPLQHHTHAYSFRGTAQDVIARLFSSKSMGKLSPAEKKAAVAAVLQILATHPDTKDQETFDIPYRVEIYWSKK
jgi:SAM-dependent methyltransferase